MSKIIEVNEDGALYLSPELLQNAPPHKRYQLDVQGDTLILRPADDAQPFWATATPEEWVQALKEWAEEDRPPTPVLSDEALRRENIYD